MQVDLEPFEPGGGVVMVLRLRTRLRFRQLGWRDGLRGLRQRGGLQEPAHFEMLAQPVDGRGPSYQRLNSSPFSIRPVR